MRVPVLVCLLPALLLSTEACHFHITGIAENISETSASIFDGNVSLVAHYGDNVTIICSGLDSENLNIELIDGQNDTEFTEIVNMTTVKLTIEMPEINTYEYTCTDKMSNCSETLQLSVEPVMTIVSPNVQYLRRRNFEAYFVPVGEDYEILCSGDADLIIAQEYEDIEDQHNIQAMRVNDTMVSEQLKEEKQALLHYTCQRVGVSSQTSAAIYVYFNHVPAAQNFWCIFGNDRQINCSWSLLGEYVSLTLFFVDAYGKSMRVYEDHIMSKENRSCGWSMDEAWEKGLTSTESVTLVLQSCTFLFCSNETHDVNLYDIRQSIAPVELRVLRTTSGSALVSWIELQSNIHDNEVLEYKVTYQLPGGPQRELNSSTLRLICRDSTICKAELKLPCPGKLYEIRVFSQYKTNDIQYRKYWSDPAIISLRTKPSANSNTSLCDGDSNAEELQVLKSIDRKLDFIRIVCKESKLDACHILESVCLALNNTLAEFGSDWVYDSEWLRWFYITLRHHQLGKFYQQGIGGIDEMPRFK